MFHIGFLWISSYSLLLCNYKYRIISFKLNFGFWVFCLCFQCHEFVNLCHRLNSIVIVLSGSSLEKHASVISQPKICHDHQDYSCTLNDIYLELWSMVGCVACLYWIIPFWLLCCIPLTNLIRLHFFRGWLGKSMRDTILRICDVYIWYFSKKNRYRGLFPSTILRWQSNLYRLTSYERVSSCKDFI